MKKHLHHITFILFLSVCAKSQIVFLNNPANHIVYYNPAFSGIHPYFNKNYVGKQVTVSARVAQKQNDAQMSCQYFFDKQNIGVSGDYGIVDQGKTTINKAGLGLAYQLLFFNEVSTAWGIGLRFSDFQTNQHAISHIYNKEFGDTLYNFKSLDGNLGVLINYERYLFGFSYQPKQLVNLLSNNHVISTTTQTLYFKTYRPITRNLNAIFWYQASFNTQYISDKINNQYKYQQHSINIHLAGKKGIIGGIGSRITTFDYYSAIFKLGYNHRKWQVLYGIEPYWLKSKYSEIIHELSFTLKFN